MMNIVVGVSKRNPVADPDFQQYTVFQSTDKFSSDISVLIQCSYNALTVLIQFTSRQAKVQP